MMRAPQNFAIVEPQLFRSCIFTRESFPFLRQLKLRSVLYLSAEEVPKSITEFCNEEDRVTLLSPITKQVFGRDWTLLRGEVIKAALEMILDNDKLPLIIVCLNGVSQTGPLVGCLRRVQDWSFTSILEEHRRAKECTRVVSKRFASTG
ncbi:hypothetical protein BASA81_013776 [Batrachochytrium salamandrivorans]|nr:hypothetical protein BASA81_013776 [Batrachochytrium salamandrivorans]